MHNRYSTRKAETAPVTLVVDGMVGHGRLLNLSVPGCLIDTTMPLVPGYFVQLRIPLGTHQLRIDLAAVRWVNDSRAGIEFIRMSEADQARLCRHVGLLPRRTRQADWSERVEWSGISGD